MEKLEHTPMSDKVKERIEKEAERHAASWYGREPRLEAIARANYISGATIENIRERNNIIDDLIEWAKDEKSSTLSNYGASIYEDLIRKLEDLKHKQP